MSPETAQRLADAVSPNTQRAYARQWRRFETWCARQGRVPLPATAETLTEYVAHLTRDDQTRPPAPASVTQAVAVIRSRHTKAGYPGQPAGDAAYLLLRDYRRRRADAGHRVRKATPITVDALRAMIATTDPGTLIGLRDRVLCVLGLALYGRRSELTALQLYDLVEVDHGLLVYIRTSKTDQAARGVEVAIPYGTDPTTCPVRLVRAWRATLAEHGITTGPLLRSVDRHGNLGPSLSTDGLRRIVQGLARRAALPYPETYSAHSLRAGGATSSAQAGAPVSAIAAHGRWSPSSTVVHNYVRAVDQWRDNPLRGVGL
ncbi:integrase [Longimycelium tulufanense]|uniref:Integrase n=1 Tax=Longimycelium tulufanense TaxID=907463 RepID=A0A8J3FZX1_9PSEU|nr:integrase [Longimycelium tulufanense]